MFNVGKLERTERRLQKARRKTDKMELIRTIRRLTTVNSSQ